MATVLHRPPVAELEASSHVRLALPWMLGSLGLTMAALIGQVPLWTLGVFACCAGWRQYVERTGGRLPSLLVRVAIFVPSATGVLMHFGLHLGAAGLLAFLTTLLSLKVLELHSARDLTVVALLGYFMILSAFFYDQSLALNLYLGVAVLANTVALIRCHAGGRAQWGGLRLALGLGAQAMPLAILLFVIFPRLEGNFLRRLGGASSGLTGMSEHLEPGSVSSLVQSDLTAFSATIVNGSGILPLHDLYWRGLVLNVADGGLAWRASGPSGYTGEPTGKPASIPAGRVEQRILLLPSGHNWLFALDSPVAVVPSKALRPTLTNTGALRSQSPLIKAAVYTVYSQLTPRPPPDLTPTERQFYTLLPPGLSARTLQLAAEWKRSAKSTGDIIRSARQFFRDGGFTYTLQPGALPPEAALDTFLFKTRRGFCEHYAAAFSTLMRAAGAPARIVVGYQGGEYNTWGKYYTIKQSDAHAWSEVWIDGKGWQREDPTAVVAPERLNFGADSFAELAAMGPLDGQSQLDRLSALNGRGGWRWVARNVVFAWQSVDQEWNLLVLGYNEDEQTTVMDGLSTFLKRWGVGDLSWLGGVALALVGIAGVLALGTLGMLTLDRTGAREDPAQRLYARFCRRVAAAGPESRGEAEGPLDFARRAAAALPGSEAGIAAVTASYVATRYAPPDGEALARLRAAVGAFRVVRRGGAGG